MNRFISIKRTMHPLAHWAVLDAIDQDGCAWWLMIGCDDAPETWTRTTPLPQPEDDE